MGDRGEYLSRKKFSFVLLVLQGLFILLFGLFTEYELLQARPMPGTNNATVPPNAIDGLYPMFMDVHSMMFLGFGFLMAFLGRYGYSSVGLNFLLGAFVIQWATLVLGLFHQYPDFSKQIALNINTLLTADFAAAAVMITFGAVLGKVSSLQLIVIGFVEIVFFAVNEMIGVKIFKAIDIGGSMFVHVFGAYFGIALSRTLSSRTRSVRHQASPKEGAVYHSDLFAMIGTIVLWLYWPSFNGALGVDDQRHRVVINTYYSLSACVVVTFAFSALLNKSGKLDMVHVQNATLAGGVAVGTAADLLIQPWGAMLLGSLAAFVSVLGYVYVQPFLQRTLHLHDTCGVHNLHGLPGILGGLAGVVATAVIDPSRYGNTLATVYPAIGTGRSAQAQAGYQVAALVVTLVMATVGGVITGFLVRLSAFDPVSDDGVAMFEDEIHWELNPEEIAAVKVPEGNGGGNQLSQMTVERLQAEPHESAL